jgi:FtsP/CotA-like multicopper oxidase with cupredoxin domain
MPMLRSLLMLTAATSLLVATAQAADVYKYKDEQGNVLYTDKPRTLPAERLDVKSQKTDTVALQARQDAELKRMQEADQTRQQANTQRSDEQQTSQLTAKDKAERCAKARERYDRYMNSQKLYETLPNNERRYLSSEELNAARASAKASMDVMCQ